MTVSRVTPVRWTILIGALTLVAPMLAHSQPAPVEYGPATLVELSGSQPRDIALGDFNQDGHLDLAVSNSAGDGVTILLGNGQGAFKAVDSIDMKYAWGLGVGDFNSDGLLDLAVTQGTQTKYAADPLCGMAIGVPIFLGNGDGKFTFQTCLVAGTFPVSAASGDFNRDGKTDLAVASNVTRGLSIFLGGGNGTFTSPQHVPDAAYLHATHVVASDLNGDARPDLLLAHYNGTAAFLAQPDGSFTRAAGGILASITDWVAVGDFNQDGLTDAAVVQNYQALAAISLGNGDGTFAGASSATLDGGPTGVAVGDLNRDGFDDVVVSDFYRNNVKVFLSDGTGTLGTPQAFPVGVQPQLVALGDWNEDGFLDLAAPLRNLADTAYVAIALQLPSAPLSDTAPPTVALTSPSAGSTVSNIIPVAADASDDVGVSRVDFAVDGGLLGSSAGPAFVVSWDTRLATDGLHTVSATAFDAAGNQSSPAAVTIDVNNAAPTITSVPPFGNANVGAPYTYQVTATGASPITFSVIVAPSGMTVNATGLVQWTPGPSQLGAHTVTIRAANPAGFGEQTYTVTAGDSSAPTAPTGLSASNLASTSVKLSWSASTDNVGVAGYQVYEYIRTNQYRKYWTKVRDMIPGTSVTLTGLKPGSYHTYAVRAYDAAGNQSGNSTSVIVTLPY